MTRRPQNSTLFPYTTLSRSAPLDAPRRHATRLLPPGLRRTTARGSLRRRTADRLAAQGGRLGSVDVRTSERGGKEGSAEVREGRLAMGRLRQSLWLPGEDRK